MNLRARLDGWTRRVAATLTVMGICAGAAFTSATAPRAAAEGAAKPVSYYRAERVAKSFAQGAVLYAEDTNYMIHTSRRTTAGMAEVHAKDTDLIYVLEGSATFVTGGRVLDPKTTAPDEVRGAAIADGETRLLSKGDVIIVPAGTPHWFKDVRGPVLYYTIKVR